MKNNSNFFRSMGVLLVFIGMIAIIAATQKTDASIMPQSDARGALPFAETVQREVIIEDACIINGEPAIMQVERTVDGYLWIYYVRQDGAHVSVESGFGGHIYYTSVVARGNCPS